MESKLQPQIRNSTHDTLRLLAASLVVFAHIRAFLFIPYNSIQDPTIIINIFYFFTSLGHQAVIIFFVLSGYYVGGSIIRMNDFSYFAFKRFLISRVTRLWIVLVPVLLISVSLLSPVCRKNISMCRDIDLESVQGNFIFSFGWDTFIGNLFFLQGFKARIFGGNAPLWSLSFEFWFYLLFFAAVGIYFKPRNLFNVFLLVVIGIIVNFLGFDEDWFIWLLVWTCGAAAAILQERPRKHLRMSWHLGIIITLTLVSIVKFFEEERFEPSYRLSSDLLLGILFSVFILSTKEKRKFTKRLNLRYLPDFSYSLYSLHFVLIFYLYIILEIEGYSNQRQLGLMSFFFFSILFISLIAISYLFSLVSERHTYQVREKILRFLSW